MWIIHIKLKCFCWKEKHFLGREKRIYKVAGQSLWENKISELLGYNYGYVNRQTFVRVLN